MAQTQGALLLRQIRRLATAENSSRRADGQLLQQFITERNEEAFAALVQRHGAMVLGVCRSVLRHQQDAEDAFQATFLVLMRKAAAIRKRQSISSWLHGVAYRVALKARAQASGRRAHEQLAERADPASAMDDLTWRELCGILHEELQRLPDKYRTPLLLCYWEGKTRDEAAEQLGWAKGTLKEQLERARKLLRGRLTRRGLVPSAALFATLLSQSGLQALMPAGLVENTVTAALQFAVGKAAATGTAATLAQGAIHTMQVTHFARMVLAVALLGTLGAGLGLLTRQVLTAGTSDSNAKVSAVEPTPPDAKRVPDTPPPQREEELLRGRWKVKEANATGKHVPREVNTDQTWTIDANKIVIQYADEPKDEWTFKLDPSTRPRVIDVTARAGVHSGPAVGIYEVKGDTLRMHLHWGEPPTRPREFALGEVRGARLFVLERLPPEKKQASRDDQLLQGTWTLLQTERDGKVVVEVEKDIVGSCAFNKNNIVLKPRTLVYGFGSTNDIESMQGTYVLDAASMPKRMTITGAWDTVIRSRDTTFHALYHVEGDTLKILLPPPRTQPPTDFKTTEGLGQRLFVFKRDGVKKAVGEGDQILKDLKRLIMDVERIRRMASDEQQKEVGRLYRTLAPRALDFRYHLRQREVDYIKDRDKLTPEAWVEKAWTSFPDAFMYLQWDTRAECYAILKKQRAVLRPLIVADLSSKNEKEVKWALQVVSEVGGKEFLEPVLEVFKKNPACSDAAIYALRGIDDPRAIAALVERHPDLLAVSAVLRSLQRKRPADPALVALLDSKDAKVRSYAASALAESGDPALVGRIEKLLSDENPQVRSGAANMALCLEKEAYQRIRPAIAALAKDPDPGVKKFVVMCLAQRRDLACSPSLLEMARDTNLTQQERYEVVRVIRELTGSYFGFDTSPSGWRPDTPKNQEALRRFAEWVEKNSGQQKK